MSSQAVLPYVSTRVGGPDRARPAEYGVTRIVLLPVDPSRLHVYWEVAPYTWKEVETLYGPAARTSGRPVVRLTREDAGKPEHQDVEVGLGTKQWYLNAPKPGSRWRARLGLLLPDGRFALLAESNSVMVPTGRVSEEVEERWKALRGEWERLFELSGGGRRAEGSIDVARAMALHWRFIDAVSSWLNGTPRNAESGRP